MKKGTSALQSHAWIALLVGAAAIGLAACGGPGNPSTPSRTAGDGGTATSATTPTGSEAKTAATVDLCHRAEDGKGFVAIAVGASAVAEHLAHGDALPGDPVPGQPGMVFGASCAAVPLGPVTITFAGFGEHRQTINSYAESGFTVTPSGAKWVSWTGYGNPAPSLVFELGAGAPATTGEARVTAGGGKFRFVSVDVYSSTTPIPYVIEGLLGTAGVFSISGTVPNTFGAFRTVSGNQPGLIDSLVIRLTNQPAACCANPMGFDNVRLLR